LSPAPLEEADSTATKSGERRYKRDKRTSIEIRSQFSKGDLNEMSVGLFLSELQHAADDMPKSDSHRDLHWQAEMLQRQTKHFRPSTAKI